MTEGLYLILHKVRGEPAFDVAMRLQIAGKAGWIIPTSGHRAYPCWHEPLASYMNVNLEHNYRALTSAWEKSASEDTFVFLEREVPEVPADLPDHYAVVAAPSAPLVRHPIRPATTLEDLGL